jgi:translation initiation factor 3 subunit C
LIDRVSAFLKEFELDLLRSRIAINKLQYLYYKNDSIYEQIRQRLQDKGKNLAESLKKIYILANSQKEIAELVSQVHDHGTAKMRVRATLYQAYHHGLHNRLSETRDLLQKTHMSQVIGVQITDNQILYNRALTQAGMAAFRLGDVQQSHEILVEIYQNLRFKELLGQGFSRQQDKTQEFEIEEKRRQIPHHMQINLQTLESFHFITSMLIETPLFAENQHSMNKQVVSKSYRKLIEYYDQKAFVLAAEQPRDHIVFAARALNKSDWRTAIKHIFSITALTKIPEFTNGELEATLTKAFKVSAMTSYIFMSAKQYKSFSFESLSSIFELEEKVVKKTVSLLILNNRLQGNIDRATNLLVIDKENSDIKQLQQLSLQYVSQIQSLV